MVKKLKVDGLPTEPRRHFQTSSSLALAFPLPDEVSGQDIEKPIFKAKLFAGLPVNDSSGLRVRSDPLIVSGINSLVELIILHSFCFKAISY